MSGPLDPVLDLRTLARGLDHAEGICWDPVRRCLWGGGEAGQVYRVELSGEVEVVHQIAGGALLGLALDASGSLYLCDPGNHTVWRYDHAGEPVRYGPAIDYPNYASFGPDGTLYVSDSGAWEQATGSLVAIAPDASSRRLDVAPIAFANGLYVHDGYLYYIASAQPAVWRVALGGGPEELVVVLERCVPDGLALDERGALYVSCYQPNQLWRYAEGRLELLFEDWTGEYVLSPTNVAFYGDELDRLALASLCGHSFTSIDPGVRGSAVLRPDVKE